VQKIAQFLTDPLLFEGIFCSLFRADLSSSVYTVFANRAYLRFHRTTTPYCR
jgi:hypothetical protein